MAGELDLGSIVLKLRADAAGVQEGLAQLERGLKQAQGKTEQAGSAIEGSANRMGKAVQDSSAAQAAAYAAIAAAATKAFQVVVSAIDAGINASERYKASMIGLQSVAQGRGIGADRMMKEIDGLTDAFFDASAAATSFKNLLSRGYSLEQATTTIMRLKDAAAFGRQANLSLAEAVQSATEGIRNENSILVDNAGVTKNVAKMWEDYARSIGVATTSLTQAQKVEAEYQGIMQETQFQVGDLAKAADTLSGKQAEAAQSGLLLSQAYGEAMTPAVSLLTGLLDGFLGTLTDIVRAAPGLTAGVTGMGIAITGLMIVTKVAQAMKAFNLSLQAASAGVTIFGVALNTAFPWLIGIGAVIGGITAIFSSNARAQQEAAAAAEKEAQQRKEQADAARESLEALKALRDEYETLAGKRTLTYSESESLLRIERELDTQHGLHVGSLSALGGSYEGVTRKINEKIAAQERELQMERELAAQQAQAALESAQAAARDGEATLKKIKDAENYARAIAELERKLADERALQGWNTDRAKQLERTLYEVRKAYDDIRIELGVKQDLPEEWQAAMQGATQAIEAEKPAIAAAVKAMMAEVAGAMRIDGATFSENTERVITGLFTALAEETPPVDMQGFMDQYAAALGNTDIAPAVQAMQDMNAKILSGATPEPEDLAVLKNSWDTIMLFVEGLVDGGVIKADQMHSVLGRLAPLMAPVVQQVVDLGEAPAKAMEMWKDSRISDLLHGDAEAIAEAAGKVNKSIGELEQAGRDLAGSNEAIGALELLQQSFLDTSAVTEEEVNAAIEKLQQLGIAVPESLEAANIALVNHQNIQRGHQDAATAILDDLTAKYILYSEAVRQMEEDGQAGTAGHTMLKSLVSSIDEAYRRLKELQGTTFEIPVKVNTDELDMTRFHEGLESAEDASKRLQGALDKAEKEARDLNAEFNRQTGLADRVVEVQRIADAQLEGKASAEEWAFAQREAADILSYTGSSAEQMSSIAGSALVYIQGELQKLGADAQTAANIVYSIANIAAATPSLNIDTSPAISALGALVNIYDKFANSALGKWFNLKPVGGLGASTVNSKSRGGGRRSEAPAPTHSAEPSGPSAFKLALDALTHDVRMGRLSLEEELRRLEGLRGVAGDLDEHRDIAERVYEQRERIRQRDIQEAYAYIDHMKAMNQMTVEEEIKALHAMRRLQTTMTQEEQREYAQRLNEAEQRKLDNAYNWDMALLNHKKNMGELTVQKEIYSLERIRREHQLSSENLMQIDERLYALREKMRDEALAKEKNSIQEAYNALTAALKRRLAEERDAQLRSVDERMRALDALTEAENEQKRQDDYARNLSDKLRELSITKSARRRRELQDEITQMEANEALRRIQAARQDEKSLLQEQKQAIQDKYATLTSEENIRQEALRMVMSNNLEQMTELIAGYGDQWKDAGARLAEQLTQGIAGSNSPIIRAMERLNAAMQDSFTQQFNNIGSTIPTIRAGGMVVNLSGITIRERADIDYLVDEIYRKVQAAGR